MCCLLHSSGTCSFFSALCSEMQLFPPFLPFVPPYSLFIWINLKMCLHVIGDTHLRGLWHFPIMNILNIFAEASGVRMLECLYSNIRRSGLGEEFSGRSFQKVYKNVHSHVSYLSSASRMWNLWLTGQIKSATFSLFWQKKLGWNTATNWLQTVCNCFCETMAELSPYKRPPGLRSLKYLPYTLYRKSLPTTLLYPCK